VRGAPSSQRSTIEDRRADGSALARLRKLALQARYTWLNALAVRARDAREPVRPAGQRRRIGEWPAGQDVV
jgi:hypothetical protein